MRYGLTLRERIDAWWERFWFCTIRRRHHEKMDSHGHCYRCGKKVSR